jgi:beta-galactosidase
LRPKASVIVYDIALIGLCGCGGSSSVGGGTSAPIIIAQPTNQAVVVGQTATFSVSAIGIPPPSYQWQKGNADIMGATAASYTTPATTLGDSGSTFRVV